MEKIVKIGGHDYKMVANALIPRIYRNKFGRDVMLDMEELTKAYKETGSGNGFPPRLLEIFENIAWVFLKEGGEDVGNDPDEWLRNLDGVFSIYEALPQILQLWQGNLKTTSTAKKK